MRINGYRTGRDDGAARDSRVRLCTVKAWCVLTEQHDGECLEVARTKREPADYGPPRRRKP